MEESPGERMLNSLSNRILELDGIIERQRHGPSGDAALNIPDDTQDFINGMKNENTSRKTDGNVKKLKKWLETKGEHRDVFEIPAPDLNIYLARFFMTIKQDNGQEYEPDTLRSFQGSFQRCLRDHHYPIDIIKDKEFSHSREVLSSKQKQLKKMGYGNKRRKSQPISETDFEVMMGKQVLGLGKFLRSSQPSICIYLLDPFLNYLQVNRAPAGAPFNNVTHQKVKHNRSTF